MGLSLKFPIFLIEQNLHEPKPKTRFQQSSFAKRAIPRQIQCPAKVPLRGVKRERRFKKAVGSHFRPRIQSKQSCEHDALTPLPRAFMRKHRASRRFKIGNCTCCHSMPGILSRWGKYIYIIYWKILIYVCINTSFIFSGIFEILYSCSLYL